LLKTKASPLQPKDHFGYPSSQLIILFC